jgi:hypothetical protein
VWSGGWMPENISGVPAGKSVFHLTSPFIGLPGSSTTWKLKSRLPCGSSGDRRKGVLHFGKDGVPEAVVPKISQETLAEMAGMTRSQVSFFMNRFRQLGFVDYGGSGLQVHSSLLNIVLHD